MARVLIVGCGCRGQALAGALAERGHAVRGTTRHPERRDAIAATGAEAVLADPYRLATLTPRLEGVSVLCWLMGTAAGDAETRAELNGARLESMLGAIVDTPVRGVVYEAAGSLDQALLRRGAEVVRRAAEVHRMPTAIVEDDPGDRATWLGAMLAAIDRLLGA